MTQRLKAREAPMRTVSGTPDEHLAQVLADYAGTVDRVICDPQRWLGMDEDPPPQAPSLIRTVDALRNRAFGKTTPASPLWPQLPLDYRVQWWVTRIGISADLAAAAPPMAGAAADRNPSNAALGASAVGLAICATAREHGQTAPQDWVPLLAKVLFDRDPPPATLTVPSPAESHHHLATAPPMAGPPPAGRHIRSEGAMRAATTLRQLAQIFAELHQLLETRPRGSALTRSIAKLPLVGIAGGRLDERGGINRAARATTELIETRRTT
jgi:hypothetical protein